MKVFERTGEGVTGTVVRKPMRAGSLVSTVCEVEYVSYTTEAKPVRLFSMSGSLPFWAAAVLTRALSARLMTFMLCCTSVWLRLRSCQVGCRESDEVKVEKDFICTARTGGDEATFTSPAILEGSRNWIGA